jgi:DNA polymerase-1
MLLIDGDIVAYKVSTACEEPVHWGDDLWTLHADAKEGRKQIDEWILRLQDDLDNYTGIAMFLSASSSFRRDVLPTYKANRMSKRKPMILKEMKKHLRAEWGAEVIDDLEADDLIGMRATSPVSESSIIVSIDKDFKTIPSDLYNPDKPELGVQRIPTEEANYNFMFQTLVGDTTDNYSGCPGVGPVKATKVLGDSREPFDMWSKVLTAYDKAGLSSKHALVQARVARILRHGEYDNGKVKLWKPPSQV